jgi:ubiquinone/menaquinone biosynthesis C-methylase UbiE
MSDDQKYFDDGAAYERHMGRWSRLAGTEFLDWLKLPRGLSWLDVGCGNGAFSELLMTRCPPSALHAVDPSEAQIAFAKTRDVLKRADIRVGDAQSLPFDDQSFDVAAMALVIHFVPDPPKAISEMARVVRPAGWVASYMWDMPAGGLPSYPIIEALRSLGLGERSPNKPGRLFSRDQFQAAWEQAGMTDVETCRIDIETTYTDIDDFWESNTLLANETKKLVSDLSAGDLDRAKAHLSEKLPRNIDGQVTFNAFANAVRGRVP